MTSSEWKIPTPNPGSRAVAEIGQGNPGATSLLVELLHDLGEESFLNLCFRLKRINLTGPALWIGYKDHCGEDLNSFILSLTATPQAMIDTINRTMGREAVGEGNRRAAVEHTREKHRGE